MHHYNERQWWDIFIHQLQKRLPTNWTFACCTEKRILWVGFYNKALEAIDYSKGAFYWEAIRPTQAADWALRFFLKGSGKE